MLEHIMRIDDMQLMSNYHFTPDSKVMRICLMTLPEGNKEKIQKGMNHVKSVNKETNLCVDKVQH